MLSHTLWPSGDTNTVPGRVARVAAARASIPGRACVAKHSVVELLRGEHFGDQAAERLARGFSTSAPVCASIAGVSPAARRLHRLEGASNLTKAGSLELAGTLVYNLLVLGQTGLGGSFGLSGSPHPIRPPPSCTAWSTVWTIVQQSASLDGITTLRECSEQTRCLRRNPFRSVGCMA